jgi:hypothetical protein
MSPAYRLAQHQTAQLAELPEGKTPAEIKRLAKKQLQDEQNRLGLQHMTDMENMRKAIEEQTERQLQRLKEAASPKMVKQVEEQRKAQIRSAREAAEYDVYKQVMSMMALGEVPLPKCHERAKAFAEHIIRHSPGGHSDVGYVGR